MALFRLSGSLTAAKLNNSIFQTLKILGVDFARFCFHESLPVAGNCRACLLEVSHFEKPVVACTSDLEMNQSIWPESLFAQKCKENIFESLLANHPLDCPICDQAGECDLQDQAKIFGGDRSRFFLNKRGVFDKNCDFLVKAIMTRCIHCTRCVRFNASLNSSKLGMLLRGTSSTVGNYFFQKIDSNLFGNVIDLCPVGALTARVQAFSARPWEIKFLSGIDLLDGFGSAIYYQVRNNTVLKVIPKPNKWINGNLINDNCRFFIKSSTPSSTHPYFPRASSRKLISWANFFKLTDQLLFAKRPTRSWLLLSETLDLHTIDFSKSLHNKFKKKIKLFSLPKTTTNNNLYEHGKNSFDFNKKSAVFFFSTNLKIEAAILNFKLAALYKKTLLSVFNFGRAQTNNTTTSFRGLSTTGALRLFEAKSAGLNKFFKPLFLFGRSFGQRGDSFKMSELISQKFKSLESTSVNIFCNETGLSFLNLPRTSIKIKSNVIFCINIKDSFALRKLISLLSRRIFWFNNLALFNFRVFAVVPTTNILCETGIYLSQKLVISKKILISETKARGALVILSAIFNVQINSNKSLKMLLSELDFENLIFHFQKKLVFQKHKAKTKVLLLEMKSGWEL